MVMPLESRRLVSLLLRFGPVALLVAGLAASCALGLEDYLDVAVLQRHRDSLAALVERHAFLAPAAFAVLYVAVVAFSLPGGAAMTIVGGFLFGTVEATMLVVVAATLGATIVFLAARSAIGAGLRERAAPWLRRLRDGFNDNALSYLLILRLVPLFPFFVVNLVPAALGVPLRTFVVGTLIGIIPGTFVFASAGAGLGSILDGGGKLTLEGILTPQVVVALAGLALLSLIPVVYKRVRSPRGHRASCGHGSAVPGSLGERAPRP